MIFESVSYKPISQADADARMEKLVRILIESSIDADNTEGSHIYMNVNIPRK